MTSVNRSHPDLLGRKNRLSSVELMMKLVAWLKEQGDLVERLVRNCAVMMMLTSTCGGSEVLIN